MPISLQHMSIKEKLQTTELLWDDLRARAGDEPSPSWHGEELAQREAALARGEEQSEDWDAARRRIREATR